MGPSSCANCRLRRTGLRRRRGKECAGWPRSALLGWGDEPRLAQQRAVEGRNGLAPSFSGGFSDQVIGEVPTPGIEGAQGSRETFTLGNGEVPCAQQLSQ